MNQHNIEESGWQVEQAQHWMAGAQSAAHNVGTKKNIEHCIRRVWRGAGIKLKLRIHWPAVHVDAAVDVACRIRVWMQKKAQTVCAQCDVAAQAPGQSQRMGLRAGGAARARAIVCARRGGGGGN